MTMIDIGSLILGIVVIGGGLVFVVKCLSGAHISSNYDAVREQRHQDERGWAYPQYSGGRMMSRADEGAACPKEVARREALGQTPAQIRAETTSRNAVIQAYGAPVHQGMFHDAAAGGKPAAQPEAPISVPNWPVKARR